MPLDGRIGTHQQRNKDRGKDQIRTGSRKKFADYRGHQAEAVDEDIRECCKENAQYITKHAPCNCRGDIFIICKTKTDSQYQHKPNKDRYAREDRQRSLHQNYP